MGGKGEIQKVGETPGFGVAGQVVCPRMSITHQVMCVKGACEFWVELTYAAGTKDENRVGRCADAWKAILAAESTQAMIRLTQALEKTNGNGKKDTNTP